MSETAEYKPLMLELLALEEKGEKLRSALDENTRAIEKAKMQLASVLRPTSSAQPQAAPAASESPVVPITKSARLKAAYRRDPHVKINDIVADFEQDTSAAAKKRLYAIRDHLVESKQLERMPDGSWKVID